MSIKKVDFKAVAIFKWCVLYCAVLSIPPQMPNTIQAYTALLRLLLSSLLYLFYLMLMSQNLFLLLIFMRALKCMSLLCVCLLDLALFCFVLLCFWSTIFQTKYNLFALCTMYTLIAWWWASISLFILVVVVCLSVVVWLQMYTLTLSRYAVALLFVRSHAKSNKYIDWDFFVCDKILFSQNKTATEKNTHTNK